MTIADDLRAARVLIDTPEKWCKGTAAQHADGRPVCIHNPDAVRFCAEGACHRTRQMGLVRRLGASPWLTMFNDAPSTTHADVMALFDRAIERAENEGR